jgi:hypothetical protein
MTRKKSKQPARGQSSMFGEEYDPCSTALSHVTLPGNSVPSSSSSFVDSNHPRNALPDEKPTIGSERLDGAKDQWDTPGLNCRLGPPFIDTQAECGADTTYSSDEGKEVENGRRHQGIEASQESPEVAGTVASVMNPDESTADTVGEFESPAGTAAATIIAAAQPPVGLLTPREDSSHPSESSGDAQNVGDLLPSGGLPGSLCDPRVGGRGFRGDSEPYCHASGFDRGSEGEGAEGAVQAGQTSGGRSGNRRGVGVVHPKDDSMEFHRKLHKFSVEQWAVIVERSKIDRERRKLSQKK